MTWLTHKQVETLIDNLMVKHAWVRVKNSSHLFKGSRPDRLFTKEGEILVMEIKPENSSKGEIHRGIGEVVGFLPYQVKPYLVLPESLVDWVRDVFKMLPDIGVLQYSPTGEITMFQKSERNMASLRTVKILDRPSIDMTKELLWKFLKNTITEDGMYSLDFIEGALQVAYPIIRIDRQTVARLLLSMGYGLKLYDPETKTALPKQYSRYALKRFFRKGKKFYKTYFIIKLANDTPRGAFPFMVPPP